MTGMVMLWMCVVSADESGWRSTPPSPTYRTNARSAVQPASGNLPWAGGSVVEQAERKVSQGIRDIVNAARDHLAADDLPTGFPSRDDRRAQLTENPSRVNDARSPSGRIAASDPGWGELEESFDASSETSPARSNAGGGGLSDRLRRTAEIDPAPRPPGTRGASPTSRTRSRPGADATTPPSRRERFGDLLETSSNELTVDPTFQDSLRDRDSELDSTTQGRRSGAIRNASNRLDSIDDDLRAGTSRSNDPEQRASTRWSDNRNDRVTADRRDGRLDEETDVGADSTSSSSPSYPIAEEPSLDFSSAPTDRRRSIARDQDAQTGHYEVQRPQAATTTGSTSNSQDAARRREDSGASVSPQSSAIRDALSSRPWWPLMLSVLGLFGSLGFNFYLGWIAWDLYTRYHDAVDDVQELETRLDARQATTESAVTATSSRTSTRHAVAG